MSTPADPHHISRRAFLQVGGAVAAGSALPRVAIAEEQAPATTPGIRRHRTLGRTGFEVSDLALGGVPNDAAVVKYAVEKGVNYLDTAETYGNGDAERRIGEAIQGVDRKQLFITTKLVVTREEGEQSIVDRFGKCLERLRTSHSDALFLHSVTDLGLITHEAFHSAVKKLKQDGKLRFCGISSHGPVGQDGEAMDKVLCAAAEDGRFDLMLLVYSYLNREAGERVLAACKAKNVGTTAMKTSPATLKVEPFDPEKPTGEYADALKEMLAAGRTREEAVARIQRYVDRLSEWSREAQPFIAKHGVTTDEELRLAALKWVLGNPDMHTVCLSLADFDAVDRFVPLSGTSLDQAAAELLDDFRVALGHRYCRHGCTACARACPHDVPVSTIMRYASYFEHQGRQKLAMQKYARLGARNGSLCLACDEPCRGACPHRFAIQAGVVRAHSLLRLA